MRTSKTEVGIGDWPRITRFYGIPPSELVHLPRWVVRMYADSIRELEAQEALYVAILMMVPHVSNKDRGRILRSLGRAAGTNESVTRIDATTPEGRSALAGMGIGVTVDSSENEDA